MYEWVEKFQWQFPGGEFGLVATALLFSALILASYFTTLRKIPRFPRTMLLFIRVLFAGLVLFCLCRPAIVREEVKNKNFNTKMAVVFDSSSSMRVRDVNGDNRISEAIECWKKT